MRRDAFVFRTPITLAAATLAAAVALTACGPLRMGAAAILDNNRISTATLTAEVSTLDAAYQADKAKIQLQFAASQAPQEVLSWLLRFRVQEHLAAREGITVTKAQTQQSLASLSAQAKQSGATLTDLAVANGVPPDQITELGRYQAIEDRLVQRLNGGELATASTASAGVHSAGAGDERGEAADVLDVLGGAAGAEREVRQGAVPRRQEPGHRGQPAIRQAELQPARGHRGNQPPVSAARAAVAEADRDVGAGAVPVMLTRFPSW